MLRCGLDWDNFAPNIDNFHFLTNIEEESFVEIERGKFLTLLSDDSLVNSLPKYKLKILFHTAHISC